MCMYVYVRISNMCLRNFTLRSYNNITNVLVLNSSIPNLACLGVALLQESRQCPTPPRSISSAGCEHSPERCAVSSSSGCPSGGRQRWGTCACTTLLHCCYSSSATPTALRVLLKCSIIAQRNSSKVGYDPQATRDPPNCSQFAKIFFGLQKKKEQTKKTK